MFTESKHIINPNKIFLEIVENKDSTIFEKGYIITHDVDVFETKPFIDLIKNIISKSIQEICFVYKRNSIMLTRYIKDIFLIENDLYIEFSPVKYDVLTYKNLISNYIENNNYKIYDWVVADHITKIEYSSEKFIK